MQNRYIYECLKCITQSCHFSDLDNQYAIMSTFIHFNMLKSLLTLFKTYLKYRIISRKIKSMLTELVKSVNFI